MATILIIDDELDCRRPLATLLKCEGYEVHEACDGQEGLDALRRRSYDLVLLDLAMPVMDGVQMLTAMRADPKIAGCGAFGDLGTHSLDILLWMFGDVASATGTIANGTAPELVWLRCSTMSISAPTARVLSKYLVGNGQSSIQSDCNQNADHMPGASFQSM